MGIYKEYILTCHDCGIRFEMFKYRADVRKFEGEIWDIVHGNHDWEAVDKTEGITYKKGVSNADNQDA